MRFDAEFDDLDPEKNYSIKAAFRAPGAIKLFSRFTYLSLYCLPDEEDEDLFTSVLIQSYKKLKNIMVEATEESRKKKIFSSLLVEILQASQNTLVKLELDFCFLPCELFNLEEFECTLHANDSVQLVKDVFENLNMNTLENVRIYGLNTNKAAAKWIGQNYGPFCYRADQNSCEFIPAKIVCVEDFQSMMDLKFLDKIEAVTGFVKYDEWSNQFKNGWSQAAELFLPQMNSVKAVSMCFNYTWVEDQQELRKELEHKISRLGITVVKKSQVLNVTHNGCRISFNDSR